MTTKCWNAFVSVTSIGVLFKKWDDETHFYSKIFWTKRSSNAFRTVSSAKRGKVIYEGLLIWDKSQLNESRSLWLSVANLTVSLFLSVIMGRNAAKQKANTLMETEVDNVWSRPRQLLRYIYT